MHFRIIGYSDSSKLNFLSHIVPKNLFSSIESIGLNPDRRNLDDFCFYCKFLSFLFSLCKIFFLFTNELFLFSIDKTCFRFYFSYLGPQWFSLSIVSGFDSKLFDFIIIFLLIWISLKRLKLFSWLISLLFYGVSGFLSLTKEPSKSSVLFYWSLSLSLFSFHVDKRSISLDSVLLFCMRESVFKRIFFKLLKLYLIDVFYDIEVDDWHRYFEFDMLFVSHSNFLLFSSFFSDEISLFCAMNFRVIFSALSFVFSDSKIVLDVDCLWRYTEIFFWSLQNFCKDDCVFKAIGMLGFWSIDNKYFGFRWRGYDLNVSLENKGMTWW
jgi:hypothetical protein